MVKQLWNYRKYMTRDRTNMQHIHPYISHSEWMSHVSGLCGACVEELITIKAHFYQYWISVRMDNMEDLEKNRSTIRAVSCKRKGPLKEFRSFLKLMESTQSSNFTNMYKRSYQEWKRNKKIHIDSLHSRHMFTLFKTSAIVHRKQQEAPLLMNSQLEPWKYFLKIRLI